MYKREGSCATGRDIGERERRAKGAGEPFERLPVYEAARDTGWEIEHSQNSQAHI